MWFTISWGSPAIFDEFCKDSILRCTGVETGISFPVPTTGSFEDKSPIERMSIPGKMSPNRVVKSH
jgi:hypothetical protein